MFVDRASLAPARCRNGLKRSGSDRFGFHLPGARVSWHVRGGKHGQPRKSRRAAPRAPRTTHAAEGQLAEHELNPVDWGGDIEVIKTSAIEKIGIQDLLEVLDYQAELLELKADFEGPAEGTVIEAHVAEGRGPVANILVQQGCLKKGDFIVAGRGFGRVRALMNEQGEQVEEGLPSTPLQVLGLSEVPDAGDKFYIVKSLKEAEGAAKGSEGAGGA